MNLKKKIVEECFIMDAEQDQAVKTENHKKDLIAFLLILILYPFDGDSGSKVEKEQKGERWGG